MKSTWMMFSSQTTFKMHIHLRSSSEHISLFLTKTLKSPNAITSTSSIVLKSLKCPNKPINLSITLSGGLQISRAFLTVNILKPDIPPTTKSIHTSITYLSECHTRRPLPCESGHFRTTTRHSTKVHSVNLRRPSARRTRPHPFADIRPSNSQFVLVNILSTCDCPVHSHYPHHTRNVE